MRGEYTLAGCASIISLGSVNHTQNCVKSINKTMQISHREPGSIKHIKQIVEKHHAKRILAVTGKNSFRKSGASIALNQYLGDREIIHFSDFEVNPRLEDALAGIKLIEQTKPDMIIAIGGGSAMDMGKLITTLSAQPHGDFRQIIKTCDVTRKGLPLVAIPTTAGTGSEATHFAVVYVQGKKYSLADSTILPDYAIVDANLTTSNSPYQAASSGMDALCQAVESYWAITSTKISKSFAAQAIQMILPAIRDAVCKKDKEAQQAMALGANIAGKAINITKTTAPHALSYPITTHYGLPHGHAVALLLGKFFIINNAGISTPRDMRGSAYIENTFKTLHQLLGCNNTLSCATQWYQLMEDIGLSTDMSKLGMAGKIDFELIFNNVNMERLGNHPVYFKNTDLLNAFM